MSFVKFLHVVCVVFSLVEFCILCHWCFPFLVKLNLVLSIQSVCSLLCLHVGSLPPLHVTALVERNNTYIISRCKV